MQFRTFRITDTQGVAIKSANVSVYERNTTNPVTVFDEDNVEITSLVADARGMVGFRAANGEYDIVASRNGKTAMIENVQFQAPDTLGNTIVMVDAASGEQATLTQSGTGLVINVDSENVPTLPYPSFNVQVQGDDVLIANPGVVNVPADLVVEGTGSQFARFILQAATEENERFVYMSSTMTNNTREMYIRGPSDDADSPWRFLDHIAAEVSNSGAVSVFSVRNTSSEAAAQVRMPLEIGRDAGTGTAKGLVVFAADTTSGIADYEARPINFSTETTAGSASLRMSIKTNGVINMPSLPTSSAGLASGDLWNDSGTVKIV